MNNESLRPITQNNSQNNRPQFRIPLSDFGCDEKARYVERVCAILIESRFGFAPVDLLVLDQSEFPESEPAPLYDLFEDDPNRRVLCYYLSPQGRAFYRLVKAASCKTKQVRFMIDAAQPAINNSRPVLPPNQGHGSP
jgi:hypothetical protein